MKESEYNKLSLAEQLEWKDFCTLWNRAHNGHGYRDYDWCKAAAEGHTYRQGELQWAAWLAYRAAWRLTR